MSEDNFEKIGPRAPKMEESIADLSAVATAKLSVEKGFKSVRDFYNRSEVRETIRKAEKLTRIAQEIKPKNPFSIIHGVVKTADTLYDFDKISMPAALKRFQELKEVCNEVTKDSVTHLFISFLDRSRIEELETSTAKDGKTKGPTLYAYPLECPNEAGEVEVVRVYWYRETFDYSELICSKLHDLKKVKRTLSALLWDKYGSQIEMDWGLDREFTFRRKDPPKWEYEGDQGRALIQRWKYALEIGMRRFVILHGDPGMGKSTLARQLGMEVDRRVLYVPTSVIMQANSITLFMDTLDLCSPDVVIIDDIDRMGRKLEELLALFEETETTIPLLLATTNDLKRLPDAIKRPGRFDETWLIEPPPANVQGKVVRYLARLEGVSLSDKQVDVISNYVQRLRLSGAHIRELVRRVRLERMPENWTELNIDSKDITFSERWRSSDYRQEGVALLESPPVEDEGDDYDYDYEDEYE
jgi:hypothetical protein